MNTRCTPEELASIILKRSPCSVQVGAVLSDRHGIFSWGWNHTGLDGFGEHAEVATIKRANRERLSKATLYVASVRAKHGRPITSKPCLKCQGWIEAFEIPNVYWRGGDNLWHRL